MRLFFFGSLGLVIFAMFWVVYRGHVANQEPISDLEEPGLKTSENAKLQIVKNPTLEKKFAEPHAKSNTPTAAPAPKENVSKDKKSGTKGDWITPDRITYLDESPQQKKIFDYLKHMEGLVFPPKEEPTFVGVNDQGFDQYEYEFQSGDVKANVSQWKRSGEIAVELIEYENGDKLTRRAPENDRPFTEISYDSKSSDTSHSVFYRTNGTVESIHDTQGKVTTIYYYDEQGRLTDVYTYTEK
jgi:hypothetical protein